MFFPSTHPNSRKAATKTVFSAASSLPAVRVPTVYLLPACCARAASGHAAAAPPRSVMNARRCSWSNGIRSPPAGSEQQDIGLARVSQEGLERIYRLLAPRTLRRRGMAPQAAVLTSNGGEGCGKRHHFVQLPSGSNFVFDCANTRGENSAASASSDRLRDDATDAQIARLRCGRDRWHQ